MSCTPFDPLVDTESFGDLNHNFVVGVVAPPSIRLWILKDNECLFIIGHLFSCTPFDPLVDTESFTHRRIQETAAQLHPLRSACGY